MLDRTRLRRTVESALKNNPVAILLGPRQCGKTTLAQMISQQRKSEYFDLEDPNDLQRLSAPMVTMEGLSGLVIIDEVQRKPELFQILRVLVDRPQTKAKFLLLGSASPQLVKGASESLAGRAAYLEMSGFTLQEVGPHNYRNLWVRGTFPKSYLAPNEEVSRQWRNDFIKSFLERDIPQLGISIPAQALRRFWTMLAHYHGQTWNACEFSRSLGQNQKTVNRYLDILAGAYVIRQLQPWYENLKKRQVKSPKIYIRDSGLLHALLTLTGEESVFSHPKLGASWEGFACEQVLSALGAENCYFWGTHAGAELDLLVFNEGKRLGFEFKHADAPGVTRSIRIAMEDLQLDKVYLVYPGKKSYPLDRKIETLSILDIESLTGK